MLKEPAHTAKTRRQGTRARVDDLVCDFGEGYLSHPVWSGDIPVADRGGRGTIVSLYASRTANGNRNCQSPTDLGSGDLTFPSAMGD